MVSVITVQYYELFVVVMSCILVQYKLHCSAGASSGGVSLVTVSCDVICSGDVSCDGTI